VNIFEQLFQWLSLAWKFASLSFGSLRFMITNISQSSVATRLRYGGCLINDCLEIYC